MDQQQRPKPLPVGISDFKEVIEGGYTFVDKSLFIKEILDENVKVALIPRMRRFGKTLNLSMLRYFFEKVEPSNAHLFKGLAVSQHPHIMAHQDKYPVIFLTFKDIKAKSWAQCKRALQRIISLEVRRHAYLLDSHALEPEDRDDLLSLRAGKADPVLYEDSLAFLSQCLHKHFGQSPVILIDEYDAPIHAGYTAGYYDDVTPWMRSWFSSGLKDNTSLAFAVVTGILRVAGESMFSGPNNATPYTVLKPNFSRCFGLLEHEVRALLELHGLTAKHEEIKRWYDGYTIGDQKAIYNPWSVIQCIKANGATGPYWANTGDPALIQHLIDSGPQEIRNRLTALLRDETIEVVIPEGLVFPTLEQNADAIWALLLYSGYLTPATIPEAFNHPCTLRIPNEEVREIHGSVIRQWLIPAIASGTYLDLLRSLAGGDMETFTKILQGMLLSSWSTHHSLRQDPELLYHTFMLGIVQGLGSHMLRAERESGKGRYDIMLAPRDPTGLGIVMELKVCRDEESLEKAATSALEQIEERKYAHELHDQGVGRILCIGIAFQKKDLFLTHHFL